MSQAAHASSETPPSASVNPLVPVLSTRWALTASQFAVISLFGALFLYLSYVPLYYAVTWRHALVGNWILKNGTLPQVDPTLPLADGRAWTTTSWLSDVTFAFVERMGGTLAISGLLTMAVFATYVLLARTLHLSAGRKRWMLLGVAVALLFAWPTLGILRPETLGLFMGVGLLALLQRVTPAGELTSLDRQGTRWTWAALPAFMALWANLDGSVMFGVALLACDALGAVADRWLGCGRFLITATDRSVQRRIWWTELAIAATLAQPLGWKLWAAMLQFPRGSLWSTWGVQPLVLASLSGMAFTLVWLATLALLRLDRRPWSARDLLMLGAMSVLYAVNVQFAGWFALVAVVVLVPHLAHLCEDRGWIRAAQPAPEPIEGQPAKPMQFAFSLISLLVIWISFALTPLATPVIGGRPRPVETTFSRLTPLSASRYLRENAPRGLVWAPEDWGDWLQWDGPPGMRVAANTNSAVMTRRIRADYALVYSGEGTWTRTLDRYGVERLVVDKRRHDKLYDAALGEGDSWSLAFEDARCAIFQRKGFDR